MPTQSMATIVHVVAYSTIDVPGIRTREFETSGMHAESLLPVGAYPQLNNQSLLYIAVAAR
jgi:hypothetical protein